ncbi:hypothetical protein [Caldilinea sp.]|uniref:hypothetical protein n=1 Tax=Caldilinea sp. TaxID=2293560 RepID=UPI002607A602|nr:hypothetical protein [Caldilinea sp.]
MARWPQRVTRKGFLARARLTVQQDWPTARENRTISGCPWAAFHRPNLDVHRPEKSFPPYSCVSVRAKAAGDRRHKDARSGSHRIDAIREISALSAPLR